MALPTRSMALILRTPRPVRHRRATSVGSSHPTPGQLDPSTWVRNLHTRSREPTHHRGRKDRDPAMDGTLAAPPARRNSLAQIAARTNAAREYGSRSFNSIASLSTTTSCQSRRTQRPPTTSKSQLARLQPMGRRHGKVIPRARERSRLPNAQTKSHTTMANRTPEYSNPWTQSPTTPGCTRTKQLEREVEQRSTAICAPNTKPEVRQQLIKEEELLAQAYHYLATRPQSRGTLAANLVKEPLKTTDEQDQPPYPLVPRRLLHNTHRSFRLTPLAPSFDPGERQTATQPEPVVSGTT